MLCAGTSCLIPLLISMSEVLGDSTFKVLLNVVLQLWHIIIHSEKCTCYYRLIKNSLYCVSWQSKFQTLMISWFWTHIQLKQRKHGFVTYLLIGKKKTKWLFHSRYKLFLRLPLWLIEFQNCSRQPLFLSFLDFGSWEWTFRCYDCFECKLGAEKNSPYVMNALM